MEFTILVMNQTSRKTLITIIIGFAMRCYELSVLDASVFGKTRQNKDEQRHYPVAIAIPDSPKVLKAASVASTEALILTTLLFIR
jgi:hypothetical protein